MVAEDLGIDQVEIRSINAVTDNWRTANGMMVDVSGLPGMHQEKRGEDRMEGKQEREDLKGEGSDSAAHPIPPGRDWAAISAPRSC